MPIQGHGEVIVRLITRLAAFVEARGLGHVLESSTGFRLPGGNIRSPDVSFVAMGRFEGGHAPEGFAEVPPDLAVEVLSPDDRPQAVLDKVGEYLQAGVSCNGYDDRRQPSLWDMRSAAWVLRTDSKRQAIGVVRVADPRPKERQRYWDEE